MKHLLFALILLTSISSPAFAAGFDEEILDIRRMIATSIMRQQGRNMKGTDKDYPGQRPPMSDDLKRAYCLAQ